MNNLTTKQFSDLTCKMIENELIENNHQTKDGFIFDFWLYKKDVPFYFLQDEFLKIIKDHFNLGVIELEEVLDYKYRCRGQKPNKYSWYGEIKMTPEEFGRLELFIP